MRLVTDFDGVWTDPRKEAATILGVTREEIAKVAGIPTPELASRLDAVESVIQKEPHRHGWHIGGTITAYADEDPFCFHGAVCAYLGKQVEGGWALIQKAIVEKFGSWEKFGGHCYRTGVAKYIGVHGYPMHVQSREWLLRLLEAGWEIVAVSNSAEEKLRKGFEQVGVDFEDPKFSNFQLKGGAQKFVLTGEDQARDFSGRLIRLNRDHYSTVLRRERPDVVIGDVFSLDLALPSVLREQDPAFANLELVLVENAYTPDWSREIVRNTAGARVVPSMEEFVLWMESLQARA